MGSTLGVCLLFGLCGCQRKVLRSILSLCNMLILEHEQLLSSAAKQTIAITSCKRPLLFLTLQLARFCHSWFHLCSCQELPVVVGKPKCPQSQYRLSSQA